VREDDVLATLHGVGAMRLKTGGRDRPDVQTAEGRSKALAALFIARWGLAHA
jgi:hypothetical protein